MNTLIKKWAEGLNKHFYEEDIHMVNRYMKASSISLIIWEMLIKAIMRHQFTPIRKVIIKKDNK